jgi:hypothetical protein
VIPGGPTVDDPPSGKGCTRARGIGDHELLRGRPRRAEHVRVIRGLVRPGGGLLACFFPVREGTGGPPFPATREEIEALWTPRFEFVEASEPEESAEGRRGLEWLVVARPRD